MTNAPKKLGRPSSFKPEYVEQARKLAEAGFTDQQMADWFEISKQTLYVWTAKYPDFRDSIKMPKTVPDERVERSLYHRANGYEWEEEVPIKCKGKKYDEDGNVIFDGEYIELVKVKKFMPPDPTSSIFWLKNRRPEIWRDKKEVEVNPHEDWLAKVAALESVE